ncbi:MAG TPA: phosphoribosylformylglycinamidine cyclo-ligase [Nitrososphaeraceae archaeon]|jgi:phosphoribosylformylglycinamidine cyclo-ligase
MKYSETGVDLRKVKTIHSSIRTLISKTFFSNPELRILSGFGHYAGLIEIGSRIMALHSDGVGTKLLVAIMMKKYDSIGIDCIAMNVNDVICVGAVPVGFVDYIALSAPDKKLVEAIVKGLSKGAIESEMPIIGGETAIVPDLLHEDSSTSFDLVGTAMGTTSKRKVILGDKIKDGDAILGIESNGLHSNGYSLARRVLLSNYKIHGTAKYIDKSIGEELLKPTRIYVRPVKELLREHYDTVHGLAHITGGSFTKLSRLGERVNYKLNNLPKPAGIFKQIMKDGRIEEREMYRTFNMGIGLCVMIPKSSIDGAISIFEKWKMKSIVIGNVTKGSGKVSAAFNSGQTLLTVD